jgi:hypothetical protein
MLIPYEQQQAPTSTINSANRNLRACRDVLQSIPDRCEGIVNHDMTGMTPYVRPLNSSNPLAHLEDNDITQATMMSSSSPLLGFVYELATQPTNISLTSCPPRPPLQPQKDKPCYPQSSKHRDQMLKYPSATKKLPPRRFQRKVS